MRVGVFAHLQLRGLAKVILGFPHANAITDGLCHEMAAAWPRLQSLKLRRFPRMVDDGWTTGMATLQGLVPFAKRCPELRELAINIDASGSHWGGVAVGPTRSQLRALDLAQSTVTAPEVVAEFVLRVFPELASLSCNYRRPLSPNEDIEAMPENVSRRQMQKRVVALQLARQRRLSDHASLFVAEAWLSVAWFAFSAHPRAAPPRSFSIPTPASSYATDPSSFLLFCFFCFPLPAHPVPPPSPRVRASTPNRNPGVFLLIFPIYTAYAPHSRHRTRNLTPICAMSNAASSSSTPTASSSNAGSGPNAHPMLENNDEKNSVVIKVGMVGDSQIGKTSLMVKYVEGSFDEDYIQTLGGQREFVNMLPLVCNDAVAILFMFDLSRKSTLNSVKEWYRQARGFNKTAIPFLIGTKFDTFATFPRDEQEEITKQAKRFAKAMHASLIFCSTSASINVQKIFKIVLAKAFDLKCVIPEIEGVGEPVLIYVDV
ncbi:hypothetical protein EVG20_g11133 [Dentipellis fragilis]|uniref:Septum-promoting GTP-binding protein 1 n=1 Tax=Dentipellis fragilis TaxID=205917 RepID=A0A4Y9XLJ4_9AGAM|nr:hypothetical protein EVG20_g11133 [Dentipellis fragilis]